MSTKICNNCGWEYPISQPGKKCKICGHPFDIIVCTKCGIPKPIEDMEKDSCTCKSCATEYDRKLKARQKQQLVDAFDVWLAKVNSVPKNYPTLTEKQWLDACSFFDGCARCESKDIDTRGFFVGAKLGGRYCDWNIIPLCEKCASTWDLNKSAFKYVAKRDNTARSYTYRECMIKIIDYLGGKLDAASRCCTCAAETTSSVE